MQGLEPVQTSDRVTDSVYEALREAIFSGILPAGGKLSVPALAEKLNVSRSPVREAVVRLTQDRLAVEQPRRGAVVAQVGVQELAELYVVREVLEGVAARLAVERGGPRLVEDLSEVLDRHEQAVSVSDVAAHTELDMHFHQLLRQACGNGHVIRMLDEIQAQVRLAMVTTRVTGGPRQAVKDHRAIVEAVAAGDPERAERVARAHIVRLRDALQAGTAPAAGLTVS